MKDRADLPERFAPGAPLAEVDWNTVYASDSAGYTDYPRSNKPRLNAITCINSTLPYSACGS